MPGKVSIDLIYDLLLEAKPCEPPPPRDPELKLWEEELLDSFSIVQFIALLEERLKFDFDFTDSRVGHFHSPKTIMALLVSKYGCEAPKEVRGKR